MWAPPIPTVASPQQQGGHRRQGGMRRRADMTWLAYNRSLSPEALMSGLLPSAGHRRPIDGDQLFRSLTVTNQSNCSVHQAPRQSARRPVVSRRSGLPMFALSSVRVLRHSETPRPIIATPLGTARNR